VAEGHDPAGELVAWNDRVRDGWEIAVGDVNVSAVNAAGAYLDDQLPVPPAPDQAPLSP
jgi:hypothetical protein